MAVIDLTVEACAGKDGYHAPSCSGRLAKRVKAERLAQEAAAKAGAAAPLGALRRFIAVRTAGSVTHNGVCIQTAAVHTFLRELRGMPLYAAVAAAVPPADAGGEVDTVRADSHHSCCAPPQHGQQLNGSSDSGNPQRPQQQQQRQGEASPAQQHQQAAADLAATAAASSSPALTASGAEPAVQEDLSVERACMLLLMSPKEVWRQIGDEALRGEVLALLDTSLHAGARASWLADHAVYLCIEFLLLV